VYIRREFGAGKFFIKKYTKSIKLKYLAQGKPPASFQKYPLLFTKTYKKMNINPQNSTLTFESVWAALMENREQQKETDRLMRESDRRFKEEREERERQREERERQYKKEREESDRRFNERMDRINEQIGGISRSNGEFCEEYFVETFKRNPTFLGETYNRVLYNHKPDPDLAVMYDQYDLILRNGETIVIVEMKYKAGIDDVGRMFRKLESYRANYPMYKNYKTYLGLASFRFSDDVRKRADEMGVVLIQQQGEKIEVISETIKAW